MNKEILSLLKERHMKTKKEQLDKLKKLRKIKEIKTARDYLILTNSIFGEKRIESRKRVIMKRNTNLS